MQPTPWGFFPFSFLGTHPPLAVSCVPSDPECSRPPGALSPRSTFISDQRARDGTRRHHLIKTSANRSYQRSIHLLVVNPVARCVPQGFGEPGYPHHFHVVSPRYLPPLACRLPTLHPTTPMSSPRATSTHFHDVFPRYPQSLPCRLPALPPTTPTSSPRVAANHSHVVFPRYPQPLPRRLPALPPTTPISSSHATPTTLMSSPHVTPATSTSSSHVALNRSHAVSPTAPASSPHATSTTPMSSPHVASNHSHVVSPWHPQSTPPMSPPHHKAALFD